MVRCLLLLITLGTSCCSFADVLVQQPDRAFGYAIGDVLQQRIKLQAAAGAEALSPLEQESDQRIGPYLYRLSSEQLQVDGERWLQLRYQIINAPLSTQSIALPAIVLSSASGEEHKTAPWNFSVSPLLPTQDDKIGLALLPDRQASALLARHDAAAFVLGLKLLAATLLVWLLWWLWRQYSDAHRLPFARAHYAIKRLDKSDQDTHSQAWIELHHAFNRVADKTISNQSVGELLVAAPWLAPLGDEIKNFYAASAERFYQQPASLRPVAVAELCRRLGRLEKRQSKKAAMGGGGA